MGSRHLGWLFLWIEMSVWTWQAPLILKVILLMLGNCKWFVQTNIITVAYFLNLRYIYSEIWGQFIEPENDMWNKSFEELQNYTKHHGVISKEKRRRKQKTFGKNLIDVKADSLTDCIIKESFTAIYVWNVHMAACSGFNWYLTN